MRVTTIAGAGLHRGLDYGHERAGEIALAATALKTHLAASGRPSGQLARRLASSPLAVAAADLTPDLWSEVTAMANASSAGLESVLLLTMLDEITAMTSPAGCSVIARTIPGDWGEPPTPATTEIGQTVDLPAWTSGRMLVLRVGSRNAPNALVLSFPGAIGRCGANDAGLGVGVSALPGSTFSEQGLPVAFVTRHLLTLTTLEDAEAFLTGVPHAVGRAYTIAAVDGFATFEASPGGVHRVTVDGVPATARTDHPVGDDQTATESSRVRLELLIRSLETHEPFGDALSGDLVLDGSRWQDPHVTLGAFRAIGSEPVARFLDGADARAGRREWSRLTYI